MWEGVMGKCGEVHMHCLPFPAVHLAQLPVTLLPLEALSIGAHRPWPTWGRRRERGGKHRRASVKHCIIIHRQPSLSLRLTINIRPCPQQYSGFTSKKHAFCASIDCCIGLVHAVNRIGINLTSIACSSRVPHIGPVCTATSQLSHGH